MIVIWITVIIIMLCGIGAAIYFVTNCTDNSGKLGGAIASILIAIAISGFALWYLYGTEAGQRKVKSFQSNVTGGITRNVRVFDMEGDVLAEYTGKFDIENRDGGIMFDDESGKRHVIYFSTGTIIVDEL